MTLSGIPQRPPLGVLNPHLALRAVLSRFAGEGISPVAGEDGAAKPRQVRGAGKR